MTFRAFLVVVSFVCMPLAAQASVTISNAATQNMSCTGQVCEPTAKNAVLNAADLEVMLVSGNTTVTTTGAGVEASDIAIAAAVTWTASSSLTLTARSHLKINKPVSVGGGLTLNNDGGVASLSFGPEGHVVYSSLSAALTINKTAFTLINSISGLVGAIRAKPSGAFALVRSYNATKDGVYSSSPIATTFTGTFEGLGNTISHLSISTSDAENVGFFGGGGIVGGTIRDFGLAEANVTSTYCCSYGAGVLASSVIAADVVGSSYSGVIFGSWVTGTVSVPNDDAYVGGLVGAVCNDAPEFEMAAVINSHASVVVSGGTGASIGGLVGENCGGGVVQDSWASGAVTGGDGSWVGGLAGTNAGYVETSFATGTVTTGDGNLPTGSAGGLVGYDTGYNVPGLIENCYSTGAVTGGSGSSVGGLVGLSYDGGQILYSYSTGAPAGGQYVGGFIGYDGAESIEDAYWDTDLSGITNLSQGAGNESNAAGIMGESTSELQSGLPSGFAKSVWKESGSINNGLPYLKANPPPK